MTTYVALLRGINVGRNKRIAMADLRELLQGLGFSEVRTLLQSGNAVFSGSAKSDARLATLIEGAIVERFGFDVRVIVRTAAEIAEVIASNPLPDAESDPKRFHVAFLDAAPKRGWDAGFDPTAYAPEEFRLVGRDLYIWYRNGIIESTLNTPLMRALGVTATARNWNTVTKLGGLMS